MICFFSADMSPGPSSALVNLSGGNCAVAETYQLGEYESRRGRPTAHLPTSLTVVDAEDLVNQALVGELCGEWGEQVHAAVQQQQVVDLGLGHLA